MAAQWQTSRSASPAPGGVTSGSLQVCGGRTWSISLSPPCQPACHSLVSPVFTFFYLLCGTRICDLNVWDRHFKLHVSLLRAWNRCQECCFIVSNIKADSDYERNSSSAEINEIPLRSAILFGLWSMRAWEVIWYIYFCWQYLIT